MQERPLKILITLGAGTLIVIHLIWPNLAVDAITVALFVAAVLPWLSPLFKSLGLPGGVNVEYRDLERVEQRIEAAGLSREPKEQKGVYRPSPDDPNLTLAWFRIEIEKRLKKLAEKYGLPEERSAWMLLRQLQEKDALSSQEASVLADLRGTLNRAMHGEEINRQVSEWALDVGPRVLAALDAKVI